MIYIYNLILFLFFIPITIFFLLKSIRNPSQGIFFKWKERLGLWGIQKEEASKKVIWFHGASLGEVRALEPLIKEFKGYVTILTVLTPSGREYAGKNGIADKVFLAPLDLTFVVNQIFKKVKPHALILFETEIWPGLIFCARENKTRIILVNGRISHRSYPLYNVARPFWKKVLNSFDAVCARSKEDSQRLKALGYERKIQNTGNIKYDMGLSIPQFSRNSIGLKDSDALFVAGSTREREENILLNVFLKLKEIIPGLKIVIAPRHLKRMEEIKKLLKKKNIDYVLFSSGSYKEYECLILDTYGDLMKLYSIADIAFVGGSLVNKGGQNPIEPAACSKVVLFGPHMQNFQSEAQALVESGGGFAVNDGGELVKKIEALLFDRAFLAECGKQAFQAVEKQKGALERTKKIIITVIE